MAAIQVPREKEKGKEKFDVLLGDEQKLMNMIPSAARRTSKFLTKYEKARILGARAAQLDRGMPPMISVKGEFDALTVATQELKEKMLPGVVRRTFPDGTYEEWALDELEDADF